MSRNGKNKFMTPFIIGGSDLAFILLFFFIMIGTGVQKIEKIEMPFKTSRNNEQVKEAQFRIEIYPDEQNADSSRMAMIYNGEEGDTLYMTIGRNDLSSSDAFLNLKDMIAGFVANRNINPDSTSIDVFSSTFSYYGLIAITLAACSQLEYPCNLVYRTEDS
jgi:hypothetical protein